MKHSVDYKIGVISDTHGLLRPSVIKEFQNVDFIIHAGDIGKPKVLESLQNICKVYPVCGNVDKSDWTDDLPKTDVVKIGDIYLYVLHDINELDLNPAASGFNVVISGHSHMPRCERKKDGVLYLNPGSAGPGRFKLPISIAFLYVKGNDINYEIVYLKE